MKVAAAEALAKLARSEVPDEVAASYSGRQLRFGPDYVIPVPFDPRLIVEVPVAVARAAMDSGVESRPIEDFAASRAQPVKRLEISNWSFRERECQNG